MSLVILINSSYIETFFERWNTAENSIPLKLLQDLRIGSEGELEVKLCFTCIIHNAKLKLNMLTVQEGLTEWKEQS